MCGFVAIFEDRGDTVDRNKLVRATRTLIHRGPDDEAYLVDGDIGLGFRRLSIIDLSQQSRQPFEDASGRYAIVFNGEIYNYVEIRDELRAKGHSFRSTGDAEVLLTAYLEWGKDCLERLNGMWAFLIIDRIERTVFGSRDRFGVKPLYMHTKGQQYIFASEMKAIQALRPSSAALNWRVASRYLLDDALSEPNDSNETMFREIHEVPAGSYFTISGDRKFKSFDFWQSVFTQQNDEDPTEEFAELFEDSVRLRMRSDVPVGVCLSGGLDSTAVICVMSKLLGPDRAEPLRAFNYNDSNFDESKEVDATIVETGAELHRLTTNSSRFLDRFLEVLSFHDEPLHSLNALVSYELYRMARASGIRVVLNGQGADETWAGYPSYFRNHWFGLLKRGYVKKFKSETAEFARAHDQNLSQLRRDTVESVFRNSLRRIPAYRSLSAKRRHLEVLLDPWYTKGILDSYPTESGPFESEDLKTALTISMKRDPLPLFLRIEDRNSMAHSIETRLPFLDYRLVSLAFRTDARWKTHGKWNKYALRNAMRGVIPERVRSRIDKMGFPVSARHWLAGPLFDFVYSVLSSQAARENEIFNTDVILTDLEKHRIGEADHSDRLLRAVQTQLLSERSAQSLNGDALRIQRA